MVSVTGHIILFMIWSIVEVACSTFERLRQGPIQLDESTYLPPYDEAACTVDECKCRDYVVVYMDEK